MGIRFYKALMIKPLNQPLPPVLVLGHPGHELRIWEWVVENRPLVFILTDGSGAKGEGRIDYSKEILLKAGATLGSWAGVFADRDIYEIILRGQVDPLIPLVRALALELERQPGRIVVADLAEGYNSAHDLCRAMVNTACDLAAENHSAVGRNLAFPLVGNPASAWNGRLAHTEVIKLDKPALEAKYLAAAGCEALRAELEAAMKVCGLEAFATEYLYDAPSGVLRDAVPDEPPYYETYGEKRVAEGSYQNVIRYHEHMLPLFGKMRAACGLNE